MSASAGRVLLIFRGTYNSGVTYMPMDVVKYGVSSYVCKEETTGNIPTNTTYWQTLAEGVANVSPEALGIGLAVSADTGVARTATLEDYVLTANGIVAVTFAADLPANATLNINDQGAKAINYRGSALVANVVRGGDTVTFVYDGIRYDILAIDGGAGHEIENAAGTKLLQRDVLKFTGGLKASDDSTNEKTVIDDTPDYITFTAWNEMTTVEQETYVAEHPNLQITNIPDTEGVINAEMMKLLWENPDTTTAFAPQDITLSSADYDFLLITVRHVTSANVEYSSIVKKGKNTAMIVPVAGTNNTIVLSRAFNTIDNTTISISQGLYNSTTRNDILIPVAIYGIKKNFQFKVNAIATELSTSAEHCMMSDGVTSVEQTLNNLFTIKEYTIASTDLSQLSYFGATAYLGQVTTETATYGSIISVTARDTSNYPCVCQVKADNNLNIIGTASRDFIVRVVYSK